MWQIAATRRRDRLLQQIASCDLWKSLSLRQNFVAAICRTNQSRSQSFVPLDQRSENESSGSIRFQITMEITEFCISGFTAQYAVFILGIYGACLKWMLSELSFSDCWSRGTKLWERDCARIQTGLNSYDVSQRQNKRKQPCRTVCTHLRQVAETKFK